MEPPQPKLNTGMAKTTSVLAFVAIIVVIGLPVWWETTKTFRVSLPYDEIEKLRTVKLSYKVKVDVVLVDDTVSKKIYQAFETSLLREFENILGGVVEEKYSIRVRFPNKLEVRTLQSTTSIQDFGNSLKEQQNVPGTFYVYVIPNDGLLQGHQSSVFVSQYRFAYVKSSDLGSRTLPATVQHLVQDVLVNRKSLDTAAINVYNPLISRPDKKTMRTLLSSPEYDVVFSLINPQPDVIQTRWKIKEAINGYLSPMTKKLSLLADFKIKSQVLYLTSLRVQPSWNTNLNMHTLSVEKLPHIINSMETKLGSFASTNPSLNFIIYVPSQDQTPLHILDNKGSSLRTNSFLVPRWGGIKVYNVPLPPNDTAIPATVEVDMHSNMEVILTQFRLLLGLPVSPSTDEVQFEPLDESGISDWELDYLYRKRAIENIATTANTLTSLAQLLEQIGNIVINEKVGSYVSDAVSAVQTSITLLAEGDLLGGFLSSKQGYVSSEKAFFDPSMLALLYFPDDQKYAVYVPLFIPVGIPVLISLLTFLKSMKPHKKHKNE